MARTITKSVSARKPKRVTKVEVARTADRSGRIRTFRQAVEFLNSKTDYEKMVRVGYTQTNFNLARMQRILAGLDNPHKKIRTVHIAGTKGKGSTCIMTASMLQASGYRTGLYTSPHLVDMRERILVNNHMISEAAFTRLIARIAPIVAALDKERPTFFEIMTAAAFQHFVDEETDICVIETGLGGRLDATNVLKPEVCGITNISYDHVHILGNTLEKIAEEKAGIFKSGVPAIVAPQPPHVKKVFRRVAEKVAAPMAVVGEDIEYSYRFESSRLSGPQTRVCMATPHSRFDHLHVPLLGEHQAENCGVALGMIDVLRQKGFNVTEQTAIEGLAKVRAEGRLEQIRDLPKTIVDTAHNAASITALMRAIGQNITYDSMVVIFGCSADKDIDGMLNQLQYGADKVIFTTNSSPRSADPQDLHLRFLEKTQKMSQVARSLKDAYRIALSCVTREDLICITGSVYLVGEAKKLATAGQLT